MAHGLIDASFLAQDALFLHRKKFWELYRELGVPHVKAEAFRALPLRSIEYPTDLATEQEITFDEIEPHLEKDCVGRIVFKDGFFMPTLSEIPPQCVLLSLGEAMKSYGLVLQNRFSRTLQEESDPFAVFNGAFHNRGAFLYVPPGICLKKPVQVLSFVSSSDWMAPRLQLFMGANAQANVIQTFVGTGPVCELFDLALDEGAKCSLVDSFDLDERSLFFRNLRASVKKEAMWNSYSKSRGSFCLRRSIKAALLGEGAEVSLKGLDALQDKREAHTHVLVEHRSPHCSSHQHFKKALLDESRSSFEGKIFVESQAQKTEAYQLNQNLLLSDQAKAYAKPNLEIFADDVKASHGATFAQMSEEELFYLRTRGLSSLEARSLLYEAFCREIGHSIEDKQLRSVFEGA